MSTLLSCIYGAINGPRRWRHKGASLLLCCCLLASALARAQQALPQDLGDFRVSFIYAAIMGTGTYKIDGRRITMLQLPFQRTVREMNATDMGFTWRLPVSIGYDAVTNNEWLERVFEEDLVTLSVLPGFELQIPLNDTWTLKPLGNLGLTRDFTAPETIVMGVLGLRALATWRFPRNWELRWGLGLRLAGEYQLKSDDREVFGIVESGLDYRLNTRLQLLERRLFSGVYLRYQRFGPLWDVTATPFGTSKLPQLTEVGLSVGVSRPFRVLGFDLDQVRIGYQRGDGFIGWTLSGKFPF